jgi:hypothetical protein
MPRGPTSTSKHEFRIVACSAAESAGIAEMPFTGSAGGPDELHLLASQTGLLVGKRSCQQKGTAGVLGDGGCSPSWLEESQAPGSSPWCVSEIAYFGGPKTRFSYLYLHILRVISDNWPPLFDKNEGFMAPMQLRTSYCARIKCFPPLGRTEESPRVV